MTHNQLVRRVAAYLRWSRFRCSVVTTELSTTHNTETPDVIGWHCGGASVLVECKTSRADFLADKAKVFRKVEDMGMGDIRFYAAPAGILTSSDVPDGWGLLEVYDRQIRETHEPVRKPADKRCEVVMLMSVLRRLELSTAVFVRQCPGLPGEE